MLEAFGYRNAWRMLRPNWRNARRRMFDDGCVRYTYLAFAVALASRAAFADVSSECIAANEQAQKLRDEHKLVKAREQFLFCARAACPDAIKQDCTEQVQKTADRIPSVVVRARKTGGDVVDATVKVDAMVASHRLDGTPIQLDPGVHSIRVEAPGESPIEQQVVVAEGEHNRVLDFSLEQQQAAPKKTFPVAAAVFTGLAIASFGVFGTFAILGKNDLDAAKSTCSPTCTDAQVDPIRTKLLVADISLGVGVTTAVTAIILYAVHFASKPSSPARVGLGTFSYAF